ncbi:hypothetical protein RHSIM_Rhsim04G0148600 [Rhododendron simsii]|uniref:Uncharacterized protein n=1 Tax=Rhododendron simsii TaxID=118357 RepID=A0A834HB73_RHOSS|nr:hypothetical protein RHSIM_Rhsim04G0148600 [Rhododendron simsii]
MGNNSISNFIVHSTGEELSDSEDDLLEVLEGVTSPTPEPPDLLDPGVKGEAAVLNSNGGTIFNKHVSKSTKRRLRKQAKEASFSSLSSGRN